MQIKRAQTFVEYILVISVVTAIMIAMSTLLRRTVQGMVKGVADQVGFQENAEQSDGTGGYLVNMTAHAQREQDIDVLDRAGNITYIYDRDRSATQTYVLTNAGYTEK